MRNGVQIGKYSFKLYSTLHTFVVQLYHSTYPTGVSPANQVYSDCSDIHTYSTSTYKTDYDNGSLRWTHWKGTTTGNSSS